MTIAEARLPPFPLGEGVIVALLAEVTQRSAEGVRVLLLLS